MESTAPITYAGTAPALVRIFTTRQIAAHKYGWVDGKKVRRQVSQTRDISPGEIRAGAKASTRNPAGFRALVRGKSWKLVRGAMGMYSNGFSASYWCSLGYLPTTGYDEMQFLAAMQAEINTLLRPFGRYGKVEFRQHPNMKRLVVLLKIVKKS